MRGAQVGRLTPTAELLTSRQAFVTLPNLVVT